MTTGGVGGSKKRVSNICEEREHPKEEGKTQRGSQINLIVILHAVQC